MRCPDRDAMCSTPFGIRDSTRKFIFWQFVYKECSTPFGIRDSTHNIDARLQFLLEVLNAFRHQRFDTCPPCIYLVSKTVLNAFRHQRFDTIKSPECIEFCLWCSTPFGIRDSTRMGYGFKFCKSLPCSTPFGIRDSTLIKQSAIKGS